MQLILMTWERVGGGWSVSELASAVNEGESSQKTANIATAEKSQQQSAVVASPYSTTNGTFKQ